MAKEWVDHGVPGSHLIWDVQNTGTEPVTLTKLVVRGPCGKETTMGLELPHVLAPQDRFVLRVQIELPIGLRQCTVDDAGGEGPSTRLIIISSVALSMSNGPATAAPRVISIAITTPPSS